MTAGTSAPVCTVCQVHAESTFRVEGLDCHEEVALIERRFKHLAGLEAFSADVVGGRLRVQYDAARLSTSAIVGAVADTGMRAWLEHDEPRGTGAADRRKTLLAVREADRGGCSVYRFDIRMQGPDETVFFDV